MENLIWIEIDDWLGHINLEIDLLRVGFSSTRKLNTLAKCKHACVLPEMGPAYGNWNVETGAGAVLLNYGWWHCFLSCNLYKSIHFTFLGSITFTNSRSDKVGLVVWVGE